VYDVKRLIVVEHEHGLYHAIALAAPGHNPLLVTRAALTIPADFLSNHRLNFRNRAAMFRGMLQIPLIPSEAFRFHPDYSINKV
jgi:hypothetical protein